MSFDALKWAAGQETGSSRAKVVLLGLANAAGKGDALAWPSIAELAQFAELDRKSVIRCLAKLAGSGLIEDSGQRRGQTAQVKVWQLHLGQSSFDLPKPKKQSPRGAALRSVKGSSIGDSLNNAEQSLAGDGSNSGKGSHSATGPMRGTVPRLSANSPLQGTRNQLEPVKKTPTPLKRSQVVDLESVFDAWNAMATANDLPTAVQLTDDRKRKLKARLAEHDVETIVGVIADIPNRAWLLGDNDRGWKANFDFLLRPGAMNRLIEGGAYSGTSSRNSNEPEPYWKTLNREAAK